MHSSGHVDDGGRAWWTDECTFVDHTEPTWAVPCWVTTQAEAETWRPAPVVTGVDLARGPDVTTAAVYGGDGRITEVRAWVGEQEVPATLGPDGSSVVLLPVSETDPFAWQMGMWAQPPAGHPGQVWRIYEQGEPPRLWLQMRPAPGDMAWAYLASDCRAMTAVEVRAWQDRQDLIVRQEAVWNPSLDSRRAIGAALTRIERSPSIAALNEFSDRLGVGAPPGALAALNAYLRHRTQSQERERRDQALALAAWVQGLARWVPPPRPRWWQAEPLFDRALGWWRARAARRARLHTDAVTRALLRGQLGVGRVGLPVDLDTD